MYFFSKATAITDKNTADFLAYKYYIDHFHEYHHKPEFLPAVKKFNEMSSLNIDYLFYLNTFRSKFMQLVGGKMKYVADTISDKDGNLVSCRKMTELVMPEGADGFEKGTLADLMRDGEGEIKIVPAAEVKEVSKLCYIHAAELAKSKDQRFKALCRFFQKAAHEKAMLYFWNQPH